MLELNFATYHRASEFVPHTWLASLVDVSLALGTGTIHSVFTLAAPGEESLTQASAQSTLL